MKKKSILLLVILVMVLGLSACGNKKDDDDIINKENNTEQVGDSKVETESESEETEQEIWGVDESCVSEKNDVTLRAYIKFPALCGIVEGTGKIAYQPDNTLVLLGQELDFNEPNVEGDKVENILPAYFVKIVEIMEAYRGSKYKDYEFEITNKESLTVNDYEMCKYTGKHTFSSRKESFEINFVAYATKLKGNDAIVYWMVLDESEDQSLGELIESHADNMAKTLHE